MSCIVKASESQETSEECEERASARLRGSQVCECITITLCAQLGEKRCEITSNSSKLDRGSIGKSGNTEPRHQGNGAPQSSRGRDDPAMALD